MLQPLGWPRQLALAGAQVQGLPGLALRQLLRISRLNTRAVSPTSGCVGYGVAVAYDASVSSTTSAICINVIIPPTKHKALPRSLAPEPLVTM